MQVATAIRGAIIQAKMTCIPIRRGYWGNKIGSVTVRLIPAPRGAGIVAARVPKKVLQMAGIDDCYTASRGSTKTLGNFVKVCLCKIGVKLGVSLVLCSQVSLVYAAELLSQLCGNIFVSSLLLFMHLHDMHQTQALIA